MWVVRASFEIRRLRRLSRGSADPRESYPKLATSSKLPCPRESTLETGFFRRPSDDISTKLVKVLATFPHLYYDRTIEFTKNPIKIGPVDQLLIYHAIKT